MCRSTTRHLDLLIQNELDEAAAKSRGDDMGPLLGRFGDPDGYGGKIPSANYLKDAFTSHHFAVLRPLMEEEVKKNPIGDVISMDVSHKAAKHTMKYKGQKLVDGHLTVTNEAGEIRLQVICFVCCTLPRTCLLEFMHVCALPTFRCLLSAAGRMNGYNQYKICLRRSRNAAVVVLR